MTPFFDDTAACRRLQSALEARRGAPFRAGKNGVDCWRLAMQVYTEAGVDTSTMRDFPQGSLNWGKFHSDSKMLRYFHEDSACRRHLRPVDVDDPILPGDLLVIRQGLSANHVAISSTPDIAWHVPRGGRVHPITIASLRLAGQLHTIYRIYT